MNSIVRFLIIFLSIVFATPALGEERIASSKPAVLMLIVESEPLGDLQQTFRNELAVEIITHTVLTKSIQRFSTDGLSATLAELRRIANTNGAEVVIWLAHTNENKVTLNVLTATRDRSVLLSVEAPLTEADTGGELAIAARRLLEKFHIDLAEPPPSGTKRDAPSSTEPSSAKIDHSRPWQTDLSLGLVTAGGFAGTERSPILLGGGFAIGILWKSGLYMDLSLDAFTNPSSALPNGKVRTAGLRPGVGVGYFLGNDPITFGPHLGLQAPWQTARTAIEDNIPSEDSWWNLRAVPGIDLRIRLNRHFFFTMTPGLGILIHQVVFESVSNGVDIYESPYVEWHIRCAITISLN